MRSGGNRDRISSFALSVKPASGIVHDTTPAVNTGVDNNGVDGVAYGERSAGDAGQAHPETSKERSP